jgi:hypothetical protein
MLTVVPLGTEVGGVKAVCPGDSAGGWGEVGLSLLPL